MLSIFSHHLPSSGETARRIILNLAFEFQLKSATSSDFGTLGIAECYPCRALGLEEQLTLILKPNAVVVKLPNRARLCT